jgi:hypothetical protein
VTHDVQAIAGMIHESAQHTPVIALVESTAVQNGKMQALFESGISPVITKPLRLNHLQSVLERLGLLRIAPAPDTLAPDPMVPLY